LITTHIYIILHVKPAQPNFFILSVIHVITLTDKGKTGSDNNGLKEMKDSLTSKP